MKILKFGGTSVGTAVNIQKVLNVLQNRAAEGERLVVVFSAFGKVTDLLVDAGTLAAKGDNSYQQIFSKIEKTHIGIADELISLKTRSHLLTQVKLLLKDLEEVLYGVFLVKELTIKTLDYIMSFGERLSAYIISQCLLDAGLDNVFVDTRQIIKTNDEFGAARVLFKETTSNAINLFKSTQKLFICTGFIASTLENETTTLGRGGSDYTASLLGFILDAEEIEIWTDVDGVLTADPGKVKTAFSIEQLTYEEAMELSHFGAKVIHPPTMQPAMDKKIPLRIKNTFNPDFPGTLIHAHKGRNGGHIIRGISTINDVDLLQIQGSGMIGIPGVARRIFGALANEKINIILVSQASSEHSICLAILPKYARRAKKALESEFKYEIQYGLVNKVIVEHKMAILAVVGENMRHTKGIAGRVFQTLANSGVNISAIAQGSSELNISMVVAKSDEIVALNAIHQAFFSTAQIDGTRLFLIGTGAVGSEFLKLVSDKMNELDDARLCLNGIANSQKMYFNANGIEPNSWQQALAGDGRKSDLDGFVKRMTSLPGQKRIFVDCTANADVANRYAQILEAGISIVTANKIAASQSQSQYAGLKERARERRVKFLYETNVGAGLPVLSTISRLRVSNDQITKIEGVLSGTLSYIFNTFDGTVPFSRVVQQAQQLGFTEPDPRQDLNGRDVLRKLLILIREAGFNYEPQDIVLEPLLLENNSDVESVEEFFTVLQKSDDYFADRLHSAQREAKVLRFIATYENGKANIGLRAVGPAHPFYHLSGADNIIAIYSRHYCNQPLVIKGPGAGTLVTASGVLGDVLQIVGGE